MVIGFGSVRVELTVVVHPLMSVIVQLYIPDPNEIAVLVVCPFEFFGMSAKISISILSILNPLNRSTDNFYSEKCFTCYRDL